VTVGVGDTVRRLNLAGRGHRPRSRLIGSQPTSTSSPTHTYCWPKQTLFCTGRPLFYLTTITQLGHFNIYRDRTSIHVSNLLTWPAIRRRRTGAFLSCSTTAYCSTGFTTLTIAGPRPRKNAEGPGSAGTQELCCRRKKSKALTVEARTFPFKLRLHPCLCSLDYPDRVGDDSRCGTCENSSPPAKDG
jgi:hypothetical protein